MPYTLRITGVIGLGGTGMLAALHMKKKLKETFGEIPPMIKFLVLDTDDKKDLKYENGEIGLVEGEHCKIEVKNPKSLIATNKEVKEWFPAEITKLANFSLTKGAKQIRALGRLAVFNNIHSINVSIDNLISALRDFKVKRYSDKYEIVSPNVMISVIASLSGGTGSGCFLDISTLIKERMSGSDRLIGYFLMPDIFVGKPFCNRVEQNAYAALKEMDYFFNPGKMEPWEYVLGGSLKKVDGPLFDAVYLINKTNKAGTEYRDMDDLVEFLGTAVYLRSSSVGKGTESTLDNAEAALFNKLWEGKPVTWASFGVSELIYPGQWFADYYATGIALKVIQSTFIGGDVSSVNGFTDDFIRRVRIKEHEADDVIDCILPPGDYKKFPLPPEFKKEVIGPTISKRDSHLNDVERYLLEQAKRNLTALKDLKLRTLEQEVREKLSTPQGLEFTRSFLSSLVGRFTEFKTEIVKERDQYTKLREEMRPKYEQAKADAEKASKAIFGTKAKIEESLKNYKALVDREANLILERERRERSIEFFAYLIDEANGWNDRIKAFHAYCDTLTKVLNQEMENKRSERRGIRPFIHEVKPEYMTVNIPSIEPDDFLKWLKAENRTDLLRLLDMRLDELKKILLEYGYSLPQVTQARSKTMEEILGALSEEKQVEAIRLLDEMSTPLWQYDQGRISGEKRVESIYLFGVPSLDSEVFSLERVQKAINPAQNPDFVATGDSKRVICFRVESAVPAFSIYYMNKYREKYLDHSQTSFGYHIHKDWEKSLPDIFPGEEESESRKYWSLALADPFNLITKTGEFYHLRSEKKGERTKGFKIKLAQGRAEAMKVFVDDADLVQETKEVIEAMTEKIGTEKVIDMLKTYGTTLEQKAIKQTDEIRKQIEVELSDIESYINSLSTL